MYLVFGREKLDSIIRLTELETSGEGVVFIAPRSDDCLTDPNMSDLNGDRVDDVFGGGGLAPAEAEVLL